MGVLANAMAGPRAPATLETAVRQRWEDPNRLAAARAGTQLMHHGMANILAPRPTVPTEQQGALEHAATQQDRYQMGLPPDLAQTDTPEMRLQAESMDPSLMALKGGKLAAALSGMVSWHGGPTKWAPEPGFPQGRPRLDKIGTGEGAAAYGHGFYSGQAKGTGMDYKQRLERTTADIEGVDLGTAMPGAPNETVDAIAEFLHQPMSISNVRARLRPLARDNPDDKALKSAMFYLDRAAAKHGTTAILTPAKQGSLYKLDIPDADVAKFLDWDAPLSQQSDSVKTAITDLADQYGGDMDKMFSVAGPLREGVSGEAFYRTLTKATGSKEAASEALRRAGIPGNKYYDQMSRGSSHDVFVSGTRVGKGGSERQAAEYFREADGNLESALKHREMDVKSGQRNLSGDESVAALLREWSSNPNVELKDIGTRNYVIWDQDVLDRTKMLGGE
jgi:hypothetical protein